ncbi:hypothetical protein Hypma_012265 [Hypsizygus marmoreus]|uniref:Uncharacterized protein n=1 Tax=Hypsizygus marmoreus TaxID=39966 RepID=A0A369JH81_HYPMA|nr:hypothetical protein Hypma_012265 [Hypsizygus marmoreus]
MDCYDRPFASFMPSMPHLACTSPHLPLVPIVMIGVVIHPHDFFVERAVWLVHSHAVHFGMGARPSLPAPNSNGPKASLRFAYQVVVLAFIIIVDRISRARS